MRFYVCFSVRVNLEDNGKKEPKMGENGAKLAFLQIASFLRQRAEAAAPTSEAAALGIGKPQ